MQTRPPASTASRSFKKPTNQDLRQLLEHTTNFAVSIYMATDEVGLEPLKRKAELQNAEKEILEQLTNLRASEVDRKRIQENLRWLYLDDAVWQLEQKALAFFVSPNFANFFQLPVELKNIIHVSDRFHIKPLVKVLTEPLRFYMLELSEETAAMYGGDRYEIKKVEVPNMPTTIESVVGVETDTRRLQFHTGTAAPRGGEVPAMYHGHSQPWVDDKHRYAKRFVQAIDKAVTNHLEGTNIPLVLSGTERIVTLYKEVTKYPWVLEEVVRDNEKGTSLSRIHERTLPIVEKYYLEQRKAAIESLLETGDSARFTDNIDEILREAELGRVDMILVAQGKREWGQFDRFNLKVDHQHTTVSHDLLDTACAVTLLKGGKAYVLPPEHMPAHKTVIAVFRY